MDYCLAQPQRGCGFPRTPICRNPVGVDDAFDFGSQGSAAHNPGLNAFAPLGQSEWPARPATPSKLDSESAYRFSAKKDLLAQLLALNQQVAAKIEKGEPVMPPGVPKNYPDAKKLVTEDCIRPVG